MAQVPPQLPPKREVALALLQTASSVYVHLDPRPDDVLVPTWFKKQPQLVLQIGLNMAVQIPDLDVSDEGISCTLSFNRSPEFCRIPYSAIFGLVGEDGRGMIWPESVPSEVAASAPGRSPVGQSEKQKRPKLRVAKGDATSAPTDEASTSGKVSAAGKASTSGKALTQGKGSASSKASASNKLSTPGTEVATEAKSVRGSARGEAKSSPRSNAETAADKKRNLPPYLRVVK